MTHKIHSSTNTMIDRIVRTGLATPALALTIVAGAALAQQGGGVGRAYEVIVETEPQDKAEAPSARAGSRASNQKTQVVVEVVQESDGNSVSVRRVNDDPIVVKLNGKVLAKNQYTFKDGVVTITTNGNTLELRMPQHTLAPAADEIIAGRLRPALPPMPAQLRGNVGGGGWAQAQAAEVAQPKVMLGVVMGEPEATTVEHLGLDAKKAVLLERVVDGLPADKAGLQDQDIIVGFGPHAEPRSADEIRAVLSKAEPGTVVKVKVIRKGHPVTVDLKLEAFNAQALGGATAAGGSGVGQLQLAPQADRRVMELERERGDHQKYLHRAEQAMKEAAELLARMEHGMDRGTGDAHAKASEAIEKAIAAMREGEAFGLEIEDMRRIQEEAVTRLRNDLAARGNDRRFWAQPGDDGEGFALTFPGDDDHEDEWAHRIAELEDRLAKLEDTFEKAINRLEHRTEAMLERLMERLERALDERDRRDR